MARYFFDLNECGTLTKDDEGIECADLSEVRRRALQAAREVMCAELGEGRLCLSCRIDVSDEKGNIVLELPFKDAVRISGF